LRKSAFIAIIHGESSRAAARFIADALDASDAVSIPLRHGWLLLATGNPPARHPDTGILAVADGTNGAPDVAVPAGLIELSGLPDGLAAAVRQGRSYLFMDESREPVFWTDHIGLSRIYHVRAAGCDVFSDDVAALARLAPETDRGMIASFLVNGSMRHDRTLHAHVRSLPVASLVALSAAGPVAQTYWRFRPGQDPDPDTAGLERELWVRIQRCVAEHTAGRHVTLPLSGGYDSASLLGILHGSGNRPNTFSYVYGEPDPTSDAAVARKHAELLGIEHRIHRFDGTNIISMLRANLDQGLMLRSCCNEIDVYRTVAADARERFDNPIFVFGDHMFGHRTLRLKSDDDMLGGAASKHADSLRACAPLLGAAAVPDYQRLLDGIYRRMLDDAPEFAHEDDMKDFLYADVSATWDLAPLRAHAAGRLLPIAIPFLDLSLLELFRHMHFQHRRDKRLYRRVIDRNLPDLFSMRRSGHQQTAYDLPAVMRRDEAAIRTVTHELDGTVQRFGVPGGLEAMLDAVLPPGAAQATAQGLSAVETMGAAFFKRLTRRQVVPMHWLQPVKQRFWNPHRLLPPHALMFRRALHMTMGLQQVGPPIALPAESAPQATELCA
jgi:hypothetical protein